MSQHPDILLKKILQSAALAVEHHRLGYGPSDSGFDADHMITLMDRLGRDLDAYYTSLHMPISATATSERLSPSQPDTAA